MGTEKQAASAALLKLSIDRFYHGKWWKDFQPWRLALADMVGATVVYRVHAAPFRATRTVPDYRMPERLDVLRADSIGGAHAMAITDAMRSGQWPETPDEPLLVLLLMSLPGCALPAQLKETTMDPKKRTLLKVAIDDVDFEGTRTAVDDLMGTKPEARFRFIQERAVFADNLDI